MHRLLFLSVKPLLVLSVLLLAGCTGFRAPVWSPDGRRVIFTSYLPTADGGFESNLYLFETDDPAAEPYPVAKNAAFPFWKNDSATVYFAGDRDKSGYYTKVYKYTAGPNQPAAVLSTVRLTDLQFSLDGVTALLVQGKDGRPGGGATVELWFPADGKRTSLNQLGEVHSPALLPNGRTLAFTQKPADTLPLLMICELDGSQPKPVFPTNEHNEPGATTYNIHACPDGDKFLFYAPGGNAVWTIRRDGTNIKRYDIPAGLSTPLMVSIAEDSSSATLTLAQAARDSMYFQVYRLDFNAKRFTRIDGDSTELLGGHTLDPRAARRKGPVRYAWFSAAGMALGDPQKDARYFPLSAKQCLSASAIALEQNDPERAVALVLKARNFPPPDDPGAIERAEARAYLAAKKYERATDAFERGNLLFPIGAEGLPLIFPEGSALPRPLPQELNARLKDMDNLLAAVPDNRLIPLLRQALDARIKGEPRKALELYRQAIPICPDEARVGGIKFLEALALLEFGDLLQAGERFDSAARSADFPQADFASGLAAICYLLDGRGDVTARATAVLQNAAVKGSLLASELNQLPVLVKGKSFRQRGTTQEANAPNGALKVWVETDVCHLPFAGTKPVRVPDKDGKFVQRRIGVKQVYSTSLGTGAQTFFRIPQAATPPKFSPSGALMAFTVSGEVFPLPDTYCDVYVLDARGRMLFGNANNATTGQVHSRRIVRELHWASESELKITGSVVDVFGAETTFTHTLPIAVRQQK